MSVESDQIPMIRRIAYRMLRRLPAAVEVGELISDGYFGLLDAGKRYDVSKGKSFENFAASRIRGAMIDGLRARDSLPRTFRASKNHVPKFVALNSEMLCRTESSHGEILESLHHLLRPLPRRARLVLQLYDLERLTMKQIAACLGVTEARVSILRKRTIRAMRKMHEESEERIPASITDKTR